MRRLTVLCIIAAGLVLTLPGCRETLDSYLCRPPGQCPDVPGRSVSIIQ